MSIAERDKDRLESWKEVASFFGRDERTVRRWEAERGLPIRRLPGGGKSRIFAHVAELERWRDSGPAEPGVSGPEGSPAPDLTAPAADPAAPATPLRPARRFGKPIAWLLAAGIVAAALIGLTQSRRLGIAMADADRVVTNGPRTPPPLAAQKLYVDGMREWALRTPAGLNGALASFNDAIRIDPDYAEAYVGLAETFNLLREYTLMPDGQAYPLARAAARRALALNDNLPEAHAALAYADFWGFGDAASARAQYRKALALDPNCVNARHWYATFLSQVGDGAGAVREIDRALALDPASPSIRADRGELLYAAGRRARGIAALETAEAADPGFMLPHRYLAGAYLVAGRDADFLRESGVAASLIGDRFQLASLARLRRGLARGGHRGMLQALLAERIAQSGAGAASAYSVAQIEALLGDTPRTVAWLRLSLAKHDGDTLQFARDAAFDPMRNDPAFRAVAAQLRAQ